MSQILTDLQGNAVSNSLALTYSFDYGSSTWDGYDDAGVTHYHSFDPLTKSALTSPERTAFTNAINLWRDYSLFTVSNTSGKGDINVYHADILRNASGTTAKFQTTTQPTGDENSTANYVRTEIAVNSANTLALPGFGFHIALHEIGHSLGLKDLGTDVDYDIYMSVMSYNSPNNSAAYLYTPANPNQGQVLDHWSVTPMAYDIEALADIYGSPSHNNTANTIYDGTNNGITFDGTQMTAQTIVDTGFGTGDKIDLSGISGNHVIDLREALDGADQWTNARTTVAGHEYIYIAKGTVIEDATTGSGNDVLTGNAASNVLTSGSGNDLIYGSAGTDTLNGGTEAVGGGDTVDYSKYVGSVIVNLSGGNGTGVKSGGGTDTLTDIEVVRGAAGSDEIHGNGQAVIIGSEGDDENDGFSSITYQYLNQGITSVLTTSDWTVAKGSSGVLGTDTLTSGSAVVGTAYDDSFSGSTYALDPLYFGGAGNDTYSFDLSVDRTNSVAWIEDHVDPGTDTIVITNFVNNGSFVDGDMSFKFHFGGNSADIHVEQYTIAGGIFYVHTFALQIDTYVIGTNAGKDVLILNGQMYALEDLIVYADAQVNHEFTESALSNIYAGYTPTTGNDTINASAAGSAVKMSLFGGNDTFTGSAYADTVYGYDGNDTIEGGAGNDKMDGGTGSDTLSYAGAGSAVTANLSTATAQNTVGAGTDTITDFENLTGSAYNDSLTGTSGANVIDGGNGNDVINEGGGGNDTLTGGGGTDTASYASATAGVVVSLATGSAQNTIGAGTDTLTGFENLTGSAFNDTLTGDSTANVIDGGNGDDWIAGDAGNDTLTGGSGSDTADYSGAGSAVTVNLATATAQNTGGAGTDTLSGIENLIGSASNDTLTGDGNVNLIQGGAGNDTMNGAGGSSDTVSYANAASAITINLATATAQNTGGAGTDTISNFENVIGSAYNDTLTGTSGNNIMEGGAGNDTITASGGTDTLSYVHATAGITVSLAIGTAQNTGGAGTDTISSCESLIGSSYNDTLTGTTGTNVIDGGDGNDTIAGAGGNDTLTGGLGVDTLTYAGYGTGVWVDLVDMYADNGTWTATVTGFENLIGTSHDDGVVGNTADNILIGGAGDDYLFGDAGSDILYGGAGVDEMHGGAVNADTFVFESASAFSAQDTIDDFTSGDGDKIDLHDILDVAFDPLTDVISDFVNFTNSGGDSIMSIDRDGAGVTYSFTNVATLLGGAGLDETTLYNNGNLLAA